MGGEGGSVLWMKKNKAQDPGRKGWGFSNQIVPIVVQDGTVRVMSRGETGHSAACKRGR